MEAENNTVDIKNMISSHNNDWLLQSFVNIANKKIMEVSITIVLDGSVVSGTLIGGKRYFELFAEEFSSAWPSDGKEDIRQAFLEHGSAYDKKDGTDDSDNLPQYIHIKDAIIYSQNGNIPSNRGVLFRAKLNSVSGFFIGSLS